MKTSRYLILLFALPISMLSGCVPSQELENENVELRGMVDSLRNSYFQCVKQTSQLEDKIDSLQKENNSLTAATQKFLAQPTVVEAAPASSQPIKQVTTTPMTHSTATPPVPATEAFQSQYQYALHQFNEKNYTQTIAMFKQLAMQQPVNDLTDNCLYWTGEAYYALGQYTLALDQFAVMLKDPDSDKADDAMMMRGNSFVKLGQNDKAREEFKKLIEQFPNSEYTPRAKEKILNLK